MSGTDDRTVIWPKPSAARPACSRSPAKRSIVLCHQADACKLSGTRLCGGARHRKGSAAHGIRQSPAHAHLHAPGGGAGVGRSPGIRRCACRSGLFPGASFRHQHRYPADARHYAQHPADLRRDGHRHRSGDGDRHGSAWRYGCYPQESHRRAAGGPGPPGQEIRVGHGGEPADHPPGPDPGRCEGR